MTEEDRDAIQFVFNLHWLYDMYGIEETTTLLEELEE